MEPFPMLTNVFKKRATHSDPGEFTSRIYSDKEVEDYGMRHLLFVFLSLAPALAAVARFGHFVVDYTTYAGVKSAAEAEAMISNGLAHCATLYLATLVLLFLVRPLLFRDREWLGRLKSQELDVLVEIMKVQPAVATWITATANRAADYRQINLRDISKFHLGRQGRVDASDLRALREQFSEAGIARKASIEALLRASRPGK